MKKRTESRGKVGKQKLVEEKGQRRMTKERNIKTENTFNTPENQVEWVDTNGKIYNSIFTFKKDVPIEIKWLTSLKRE